MSTELIFEWDTRKAALNRAKHRVSFEEAASAFLSPLARIFADLDHSFDEEREILIGHSSAARLIVVSFTTREPCIRIISARRATAQERLDYEENITR